MDGNEVLNQKKNWGTKLQFSCIQIVAEEPNLVVIINIPGVVRVHLVDIQVELAIVQVADELERHLQSITSMSPELHRTCVVVLV